MRVDGPVETNVEKGRGKVRRGKARAIKKRTNLMADSVSVISSGEVSSILLRRRTSAQAICLGEKKKSDGEVDRAVRKSGTMTIEVKIW